MVGVNSTDRLSMFDVELHPKSTAGSVWGTGLVIALLPGLGLGFIVNLAVLTSN